MKLSPGTGDDLTFVRLVGGEQVTMWHGPAGGWSIPMAGEVTHSAQTVAILSVVTAIEPEPPVVIAGAEGADDTVLLALAAYDDELCSGLFWDARAFIDDSEVPEGASPQDVICSLEGQQLEIETTVTEILAVESPVRSVTSSVIVVAALDPIDETLCD
jgi:hypothetical protein